MSIWEKSYIMLTQRILAGFIIAGLAGAMLASGAKAESETLLACQQECAGSPACIRACGGIVNRKRTAVRPPRTETPPPTVKSWQDDLFDGGKGGGGGGGGR